MVTSFHIHGDNHGGSKEVSVVLDTLWRIQYHSLTPLFAFTCSIWITGHRSFDVQLKLFLKTLTAAKQSTVYNFFNSMNDLSEAISLSSDLSYSANTEATNFPFVTVKNFESRASHVRELGGYPSVFWAPLVEEVQADDWAAYAQNNSWWRAESIDFDHATNPQAIARSKYLEGNFTPFIYEAPKDPETGENMFIKPTYPGPYVPLWQVSPPPVNTFFVNHDKFDKAHIKSAFGAASRLKLPVYTDFFDLREASSLQQEDEVHIAFHQQFTDKKVTAESAYEHVRPAFQVDCGW